MDFLAHLDSVKGYNTRPWPNTGLRSLTLSGFLVEVMCLTWQRTLVQECTGRSEDRISQKLIHSPVGRVSIPEILTEPDVRTVGSVFLQVVSRTTLF